MTDARMKHRDIHCYGSSKPEDIMPVTVHCMDEEILEWLERRERGDDREHVHD